MQESNWKPIWKSMQSMYNVNKYTILRKIKLLNCFIQFWKFGFDEPSLYGTKSRDLFRVEYNEGPL